MQSVQNIQELVETNKIDEAKLALDSLLSFGRNNKDALKIKAYLMEWEGYLDEAHELWEKIHKLDDEDREAQDRLFDYYSEDQELIFFTEPTQNKGRKFIALPRAMIRGAYFGLGGCVLFLAFSKYIPQLNPTLSIAVTLASFFLLVIGPWILLTRSYFFHLNSVLVDESGITLNTRVRSVHIFWTDVQKVSLLCDLEPDVPDLWLSVKSKDLYYHLQVSRKKSDIKARRYLLREIKKYWPALERSSFKSLGDDQKFITKKF